MGLSGYYSLDGSLTTWLDYDSLPGASPAMSKLYQDMLSGSGDGVPWFHFDKARIEGAPVTFDRDNMATVTLSPEDANSISSASFILCSYDEKGNRIYLGRDEKMEGHGHDRRLCHPQSQCSRLQGIFRFQIPHGIHLPVKGSKHPGRVAAIRSQRAPFLITQLFDFRNPLGAGKEACLANCPNEGVVCAWRLQILKEQKEWKTKDIP